MAKQTGPSLQRAEHLRRANARADAREARLIREWNRKRGAAETATEKRTLDVKYGAKVERADKKGNAAYKKYYDYVHENFTRQEIGAAMNKSKNGFTSESFLTRLFSGGPKTRKAAPNRKSRGRKRK